MTRLPRREGAFRVPRATSDDGVFEVDATWGTVWPLEVAPGVATVGELEVIAHLEAGLPLCDTRPYPAFAQGTLPGAFHVHHEQIVERMGELDRQRATVMFCNGPQCSATPWAIGRLLAAGYPAHALRFYRGGLHDWITLGYPIVIPAAAGTEA